MAQVPSPLTRPPGRPRSPEADVAILKATLELLAEVGYTALSMEQVRVRAGVGKATIYRRYASLDELVKAAIGHLSNDLPVPDTGSLASDLSTLGDASIAQTEATEGGEIWLRLLAEAATDPELHALCSERLVEPWRAVVRQLLERAIARGEIRKGLDLEIVMDLLVGAQVYRLLVGGMDMPAVRAREAAVYRTLLEGIGP